MESISGNLIAEILSFGSSAEYPYSQQARTFEGVTITGPVEHYINQTGFKPNLYFKGCVFSDKVIIDDGGSFAHLVFESCVYEGEMKIDRISAATSFRGQCVFQKRVELIFQPGLPLILEGHSILSDFVVSGRVSSVRLAGLNWKRKECSGYLYFSNLTCDTIFTIISCRLMLLELGMSTSFYNFSTTDSIIDSIVANDVKLFHQMSFSDTIFAQFFIDNVDHHITKHRHLLFTGIADSGSMEIPLTQFERIEIAKCNLKHLKLTGLGSKELFINVEGSRFGRLELNHVSNQNIMSFKEIRMFSNDILEMHSCNLKGVDFINCSFRNARWVFYNTKLTELFLANTDFPRTVGHHKNNWPAQAQLAYGQLATAFQKQGDTVRALEYQSREIEAYYESIKEYRKKRARLSMNFHAVIYRFRNSTSGTFLTLWMNKHSNNFGRSWLRSALVTISMGVAFFYIIVLNSPEYKLAGRLDFKSDFVKSFIYFLNPLRFYDTQSLFVDAQTGKSYLTVTTCMVILDFVARLLVAYGYYQTIQAFRRFGRK